MNKIAPDDDYALELTLLNRNVVSGFNFGWRSTPRSGIFVLEDTRGPSTTIYLNSSLRFLERIYRNLLKGADPNTPEKTFANAAEYYVSLFRKI
jgi:hypothetical protein